MKFTRLLLSALMAMTLMGGAFGLVSCGSDDKSSSTSQDNCYGDDLPAVKSS